MSQQPGRVPYWAYTDPGVYEREQERIFSGPAWNYVALSCEVRSPGDFKQSTIGEKPVVVVRNEAGELVVFANRCAHRGVQFCREGTGNAKWFMCPYHHWTYGLDGQLQSIPFRLGLQGHGGMPADFCLEEHGLERLAVAERHGVVFASFGADVQPFTEYLGASMLSYFDRVFDGRELRVLGYESQRVPANWKLMFENIKDPYHASLLHVFLVTFGLFRADQQSEVRMDETGRHSVLVSRRGEQKASDATAEMDSFRSDFSLRDPRVIDVVREFPGEATVVMQTIWPNLIVQQQSNTLAMRQLVTRGPAEFDLRWTFFGYADDSDDMTQRRLFQANLMGPSGFVSIDDSEVMRLAQIGASAYPTAAAVVEMGGLGTHDEEHMVTEAAIRAFYRHYWAVMADDA
jgi:salicylate 5-hydroxylase large subunit